MQLTSAANVLGNPALDILVISITATSLLIWQSVIHGSYANATLSTLEMSFIANIIFLSFGTYYASLSGLDIDLPSYLSAGVALATFVVIFFFHVYLRLKGNMPCIPKCTREVKRTIENSFHEERDIEDEPLLDCNEIDLPTSMQ